MNHFWTSDLETGNPVIDNQHKSLVASLFDVINALKNPDQSQPELINNYIKELELYVRYHFDDEEELMKSVEFTDLKNHQAKHGYFKSRLNTISSNFYRGLPISAELTEFMYLIFGHFRVEDKKIAQFIKSKQSSP